MIMAKNRIRSDTVEEEAYMDLDSPILSSLPNSKHRVLPKLKNTPSTSTRKKPSGCEVFIEEEEECAYSPNTDSVFDLTEVDLHTPLTGSAGGAIPKVPFDRKVSVPPSVPKSQKASISSANNSAVCRICHSGEFSSPVKGEPLISACYCRGTMGLFHRSCLEMWLSTSNRVQCEICKFGYVTDRVPRPLSEFVKNPGNMATKRNMIGDFVCWIILTPLTMASAWLCISGAVHYSESNDNTVEVPGLICLAVFLVITYAVWITVSLRYHYKVWQDWRSRNQQVRVLEINEVMKRVISNSNNGFKKLVSNGTPVPPPAPPPTPVVVSQQRRPSSTTLSPDFPRFQVPWNSSLDAFRANLAAAAASTASPATVTIRFAYPSSIIPGVSYETAV